MKYTCKTCKTNDDCCECDSQAVQDIGERCGLTCHSAFNNPKITLESALLTLRKAGWSVAVHNDYKQNGKTHTIWIFAHSNGTYSKGEGKTDLEAIKQVLRLQGFEWK